MADSKEAQFQQDIVDILVASGWQLGKASQYDRATALYTEDVIAYQKAAWPERWDKLCSSNPQKPEQVLIQQVERHLKKLGTLAVLRHGFSMPGIPLTLCSFMPDHAMNPESVQRYQANILRVVPEVSYSPHAKDSSNGKASYNPRLDLVLFVNGLPLATLELKSAFKQSLEAAKRQYRKDRPLKAPTTRKEEPLLAFKRGALVHFVARQDEIAMTTRLAGDKTFFLPFNRGSEEGGAGNPPAEDANSYATDYLWKQVLQPDAWLKIIGRFLHLEKKSDEDFEGNRPKKETMIFPRFHQWQVVNQLLEATRRDGAGNRYLVQHSAGSGKSNSIAWTAHQLANLYAEDGSRMFNSVIVVTDRTVLDSQLQKTIHQFEHAYGVVCRISREGASASKSAQLADALAANTRIIIVTLQTFPALFDALEKRPKLAQGHYAVIADEAHSSQTGSSAGKLKSLLNSAGQTNDPEAELSSEEVMEAAVAARSASQRISYYAFTATPKGRTLELFGVRPEPELPASDSNKPRPFHLYSMRQAIEEGFILDVLRRYTTYKTAWKLSHPDGDEIEVDSKKASRTLARWVRLHPHNINQRVEVIVEHFRHNVRHLLNGQAKAMVVTSSRQEAVRYQLAMLAYVKDKGYDDVHPLVAFSGTVPADDVIPEEVSETSALLNAGVNNRDLAQALDSDDFNVMIAANKYQTGFDQPKLCAMYVDKKLQGVECVQTLSRLNRLFPGKETFILDFFNDTQDILDAFAPYYRESELATVSDPQVIYDMQQSLDETGIYHGQEVTQFAEAFFDPKAPSSKLSFYCDPARDRFNKRYVALTEQIRIWRDARDTAKNNGDKMGLKRAEQELKDAGTSRDELDLFRKNLKSFVRAYEFLSQIISYEDTELEQLCVFAKHLSPLLREDRLSDPELDVSELELTHYRQTKHQEQELRLEEQEGEFGLDSITEVGSGTPKAPEKKKLDEIIATLNDLFGSEIEDDDQLHYTHGIANRLRREEDLMNQVNNYSRDDAMKGLLPQRLSDVLIDSLSEHEQMSTEILSDSNSLKRFAYLIYQLLNQNPEDSKGVQR